MRNKILLVLLISFFLVPAAAFAQEEPEPPITNPITITGQMVVDCDSLSLEGLEYVRGYGICLSESNSGYPETATNNFDGVVTNGSNSNTGNCGTVTLSIDNDIFQGNAMMKVKVESSIGIMTSVSYTIAWTNLNTLYSNATVGGTSIGLGTVYNDTRIVFTGAGDVFGTLTGWAQVNLLVRCNFIPTSTTGRIR